MHKLEKKKAIRRIEKACDIYPEDFSIAKVWENKAFSHKRRLKSLNGKPNIQPGWNVRTKSVHPNINTAKFKVCRFS